MSTEQFVAALSECDLNPTEIADILWLALRQLDSAEQFGEDKTNDGQEDGARGDDGQEDGAGDDDGQEDEAGDDDGQEDEAGDDDSQEDGAEDDDGQNAVEDGAAGGDLPPGDDDEEESGEETGDEDKDDGSDQQSSFDIAAQDASGVLPEKAVPISVPDAGFLEETLPLVRALRPILKQIASETVSYVDEAATVDRIAETNIWSPVLQPDYEPWFDVAFVIDSSASMHLWERLIQDIQRLLRCYGSFRDFRVWQLKVTEGQVGICAVPDQVMRHPRALLAPDGRRLTLVFSDCTAEYWWDGTLQPMLALWGESMPTSIWQVLPDWMWKRTALGVGEYVAIRNRIPGATNGELNPIFLSLRPSILSPAEPSQAADSLVGASPAKPICVPVITTESESLSAWSRMVAGDRRSSTPGFVLPERGWEKERPTPSDDLQGDADQQEVADQQLEQFRLRATPEARRLAALLSAAPVITLPIMRLIRASMLSGTSPLPVAEVFLGGLLKRTSTPGQTPDKPIDTELVQYDLPIETRNRLLDVLPKVEAIEVIEAVSQHISEQLGLTLMDFRALLLSLDLKQEADQYDLKAFARVTAQILRKLGKEYAALADQFEVPLEPDIPRTQKWLDLPLEEFEHESARLVALPSEPRAIALTIVTLSIQPDYAAGLEEVEDRQAEVVTLVVDEAEQPSVFDQLEPFPIQIATVERQGSEWVVNYTESEADRYIETLPGGISLELARIPSGGFMMGAPEDEPERHGRETQHRVTIAYDFLMGRYPVTQAQWRVVASSLPQIVRNLKPAPSKFKEEKRPVERVSWHEAIEFCNRLNRYFEGRSIPEGYEYRLPSEIEWEYACRAETTTPFYFGPMITTEVANYSGSSYDDGPTGKRRGETTPVTEFNHANQFGLSDMHGNVWEWCLDEWWHQNYRGATLDGSTWLENTPQSNNRHVRRGGSWISRPRYCRSAYRLHDHSDLRSDSLGFRVVLAPQ
ncbi:MAG: SAV_2336 N-terminal domain-related protein [Cyanobacteria bacterium P01_F01_bin.150]